MWTRRRFLQTSALTLAAIGGLPTAFPARASEVRGPLGKPIGLQLYTLRDAINKDLPGTLRTIAAMGYGEVELAGLPDCSVAVLKATLADCGLAVPSMHASMQELQVSLPQRLDYAQALGIHYLVCSFPSTQDARAFPNGSLASGMTLDDWKWNADQLNRIGEHARTAGVQCAYHNHNMEFRAFDGVLAWDELLRRTDPALVTIELDIGWIATAGLDPVACLRKYADRVSLLHIKDVRKDLKVTSELQAQTTEIGNGKIAWDRVFAAANSSRVRHYFVEQENFEQNPLDAVKRSIDYLRQLAD